VQAARDNRYEADEGLPDPRLNPMINPSLGKNLGRWADVYYTTPPEKRDAAVLELVRELENAPLPAEETEPSDTASWPSQSLQTADAALTHDSESELPKVGHRFCVLCGARVPKEHSSAPVEERTATPIHDAASPIDSPGISFGPLLDEQLIETSEVSRRPGRRKHILFVLMACALLVGWSVRYIRVDNFPQAVSLFPVPPVIIDNRPPSAAVAPIRNTPSPPVPPKTIVPSPKIRKPSAGKPVECMAATLSTCPGAELYRKTMELANAINAHFIAYDKHMALLLRDAKGSVNESARQKQERLRRANLSAQLWERSQLASYSAHEKSEALKYRRELMRRATGREREKKLANTYEAPTSCLQLHYIAEDLRRLAAKLPRSQYASGTTGRSATNVSRP
jgi:hypothetical protein